MLIELVQSKKIYNHERPEALDCSGATSEYLKLYQGNSIAFEGELHHCIDGATGSLCGDTQALVSELTPLFDYFSET